MAKKSQPKPEQPVEEKEAPKADKKPQVKAPKDPVKEVNKAGVAVFHSGMHPRALRKAAEEK